MDSSSVFLILLSVIPGHFQSPHGEVRVSSVGPASDIHSYSMGRYKMTGQHNGFPTFQKIDPLVTRGKVTQRRHLYVDDDNNWAISNDMHTPAVSLYSLEQAKPCGTNQSGDDRCKFGSTWKYYTTEGFKIDRGLKVYNYDANAAEVTTTKSEETTTIKINRTSSNSSNELSLNELRTLIPTDQISSNEINGTSIPSDEKGSIEDGRTLISFDKNITKELKEISRSSRDESLNESTRRNNLGNITFSYEDKINTENTNLSTIENENMISTNEVKENNPLKDSRVQIGNKHSEASHIPLLNEEHQSSTFAITSGSSSLIGNNDTAEESLPPLVNVTLTGGGLALYPRSMGLYKLQPHKSNNFPVWKHQSSNIYIRVESTNLYWTIGKDNWQWPFYLPKNSPTPALPFNQDCWKVKHTVWMTECDSVHLIYGVRITKPPLNQTKAGGQTMKMPCEGDSIAGAVSIAWYRRGRRIQNIDQLRGRSRVTKRGTLVVRNVSPDDAGPFVCEVSDDAGRLERAEAFLNVEFRARVVKTPVIQYLTINQPGVIQCHFESNPAWSYVKWTKDGHDKAMKLWPHGGVYNNFDSPSSFRSLANGSMAVNHATPWHAGNYTCTPYNKLGTKGKSGMMQVHVKDPPLVHIGVRCKQTSIFIEDLIK